MRKKRLGRTGIELPIVGIGTAFTGIPTQNQTVDDYEGAPNQADEELGIAALTAALDAGCRFIDTAALYGRTLSEKMIGEALRRRPELKADVVVTTKAGRVYEGYDFSFEGVVKSVYASLERLGLDALDIVYIHDAMGRPMEEILSKQGALGALRHLQAEGIVKYVGTAANDPATNAAYIQTGEFDAAVIADCWSLINLKAREEIFPAASKHDVGLVTATPLERGLLVTGPVADARYLNRNFSQACLDHVGRIQRVSQRYDVPMIAAALQWCPRHPQVASVIPGVRLSQEAETSMAAARMDIPDELWADLQPLAKHFDTAIPV